MPAAARPRFLAGIIFLAICLSGCASLTDGYANNWAGFQGRNEMCKSVRTFVRAPLGDDGARRAWFLPFGAYEDGSVDFYAPMGSNPSDEHSRTLYRNKVGQLTHYHLMPRFASVVSGCLHSGHGFSRNLFDESDDGFRASFRDTRLNRRIEIAATSHTASFVIATADWNGDMDEALNRPSTIDCEEEPDTN